MIRFTFRYLLFRGVTYESAPHKRTIIANDGRYFVLIPYTYLTVIYFNLFFVKIPLKLRVVMSPHRLPHFKDYCWQFLPNNIDGYVCLGRIRYRRFFLNKEKMAKSFLSLYWFSRFEGIASYAYGVHSLYDFGGWEAATRHYPDRILKRSRWGTQLRMMPYRNSGVWRIRDRQPGLQPELAAV